MKLCCKAIGAQTVMQIFKQSVDDAGNAEISFLCIPSATESVTPFTATTTQTDQLHL